MKRTLIGLSGYIGSGKSTVAKAIWEDCGMNCCVMSFSEPMKKMVKPLLADLMDHDEISNRLYTQEGKAELIQTLESFGIQTNVRDLLQKLGTEWGRDSIHPDLWAAITIVKYRHTHHSVVVIDDVRFENEARLIQAEGGKIFQIVRDGVDRSSDHSSEDGIPPKYWEAVIHNNETPKLAAGMVLSLSQ